MYNRYVPQPDGSYTRNKMPEPRSGRQNPPNHPHHPPSPPPAEQHCPEPEKPVYRHAGDKPGNFLRQLLPKDFDTGDLIVVLLLLLMAGDCEEDRNNAILTIALYFLM